MRINAPRAGNFDKEVFHGEKIVSQGKVVGKIMQIRDYVEIIRVFCYLNLQNFDDRLLVQVSRNHNEAGGGKAPALDTAKILDFKKTHKYRLHNSNTKIS